MSFRTIALLGYASMPSGLNLSGMKVARNTGLLCAVVVMMLASQHCAADIILEFDSANYDVAPGQTVDVMVSLTQTSPTTVLTDGGLFSFGYSVNFSAAAGTTDIASVLAVSDIFLNPEFDDTLGQVRSVTPGESASYTDSVIFTPPTGMSIALGTMRFTAGNVPGEVTNLSFSDFDGSANFVSGFGTTLDSQIGFGQTATITVSSVPEPSSALMGFVVLLGAIAKRRRTVQA